MKTTVLITALLLTAGSFATEAVAQKFTFGGQQSDTVKVRVKGVGISPDAALLNAYSRAVESAIGTYVSAQTQVSKDELIRDEILTHAKGTLDGWTILSQGQEDGSYFAEIEAKVSRNRLARRLTQRAIDFDGKLLRFEIDNQFEKQNPSAAKIIAQELTLYGPDRFYKAEITGRPKTSKTAGQFTLAFDVKLKVDAAQWARSQRSLRSALQNVSTMRLPPFTVQTNSTNPSGKTTELFSHDGFALRALTRREFDTALQQLQANAQKRGEDWSYPVFLLSSFKRTGPRLVTSTWETYRLPAQLPGLKDILSRRYEVSLTVTAKDGSVLATTSKLLNGKEFDQYYAREFQAGFVESNDRRKFDGAWLGPFLFSPGRADRNFFVAPELSIEGLQVTLSKEELDAAASASAVIQEVSR